MQRGWFQQKSEGEEEEEHDAHLYRGFSPDGSLSDKQDRDQRC